MNVQEWGCFSNFLRSDDVTRTMSKGGGGACECPRVGCFSNFLRSDDVTRTMSKGGGACEKSCIRACLVQRSRDDTTSFAAVPLVGATYFSATVLLLVLCMFEPWMVQLQTLS